ncbi:MAG: hypothetical protein NWE95_07225 [Candidatus Bathyarchaeota archaeon]|nr:hypothetical protein [Candidatus Bathyarchaeota archaeon]
MISEEKGEPYFPRIWVDKIEESWEEAKGEFASFGRRYRRLRDAFVDVEDKVKIG